MHTKPHHMKFLKTKEKEKNLISNERHSTIPRGEIKSNTGEFSLETIEARRKLHRLFQILKERNDKPRIQCLINIYAIFRNERKVNTFSD